MGPIAKQAFEQAIADAHAARQRGELEVAFAALERAHVLGQRDTWAHLRSHGMMLCIGWLRRDTREAWGQITRLVAAALFSRVWVPAGNTGGANVSALRRMPIDADLQAVLKADAASRRGFWATLG